MKTENATFHTMGQIMPSTPAQHADSMRKSHTHKHTHTYTHTHMPISSIYLKKLILAFL